MNEIDKLTEEFAKYLHGVDTDWEDGCYLRGEEVDKMCEWLDIAYRIGRADGLRKSIEITENNYKAKPLSEI